MSCNRGCIQAAGGLSRGGTRVPANTGVRFAWLNKMLGGCGGCVCVRNPTTQTPYSIQAQAARCFPAGVRGGSEVVCAHPTLAVTADLQIYGSNLKNAASELLELGGMC